MKSLCLQEHTLTDNGREGQESLGGLGQTWEELNRVMCVCFCLPLSEHELLCEVLRCLPESPLPNLSTAMPYKYYHPMPRVRKIKTKGG